ncbi:Smr/MutS family protein [Ruixingdingia sedimenti]|uniref:Smr/MutS family protein n=1 Tax=Ruixingdingia sedimenti TaxID=3073604 RepID=A0ABU1F886_9RHOB|nr:Smr/MutS family protein [Xinfangfangia sp. LG-4]MDR5652674.1 Smr/MutS family protein [Xinfangfangia sp. LG-4]
MARPPRPLHPEEAELWDRVARSTRPLHPHRPKAPEPAAEPPALRPPLPRQDAPGLSAFRIGAHAPGGARSHDLAPPLRDELAAAPLRMDARTYRTMRRGKTVPEARLDLHGMTLAEAHGALIRFILGAHAGGLRLVLVITGKGKMRDDPGPIPARMGALRHQVPRWLHLPPLSAVVLQVAEAHLKHGGAGACYVYLRRHRGQD